MEWISRDEVEEHRLKAETDFEEFWKSWVWQDGEVTPERVKLELYDYHRLMQDAARVYDHVTNGMVSKPNTDPVVVIAMADDAEQKTVDELVKEGVLWAEADRVALQDRVTKLEKMIEDWVESKYESNLDLAYAEYVEELEGETTEADEPTAPFLRDRRGGGDEGGSTPIEPETPSNEPVQDDYPNEGTVRETL